MSQDKTIWKRYEVILPLIISILALGVSVLSLVETYRRNNLDTTPLYHISAEIAQDLPLELVETQAGIPVASLFEDVPDPDYRIGMVTFWIDARVTNIGVRSFSISNIDSKANLAKRAGELTTVDFGMYHGVFFPPDQPINLPILVEPGRQVEFYVKVSWPITEDVAKVLSSKLLNRDYLFASANRLIQEQGLSFKDTPPRDGYILRSDRTSVKLEIEIAGEQYAVVREVYFP